MMSQRFPSDRKHECLFSCLRLTQQGMTSYPTGTAWSEGIVKLEKCEVELLLAFSQHKACWVP